MAQFRFRAHHRIKLDRDVKRVLDSAHRVSNGWMALAWDLRLNPGRAQSGARLAVRIPKKYGNAVERNRARRLLREAFRLNHAALKPNADLVLFLRPQRTPNPLQLDEVQRSFHLLCVQAQLRSQ